MSLHALSQLHCSWSGISHHEQLLLAVKHKQIFSMKRGLLFSSFSYPTDFAFLCPLASDRHLTTILTGFLTKHRSTGFLATRCPRFIDLSVNAFIILFEVLQQCVCVQCS